MHSILTKGIGIKNRYDNFIFSYRTSEMSVRIGHPVIKFLTFKKILKKIRRN